MSPQDQEKVWLCTEYNVLNGASQSGNKTSEPYTSLCEVAACWRALFLCLKSNLWTNGLNRVSQVLHVNTSLCEVGTCPGALAIVFLHLTSNLWTSNFSQLWYNNRSLQICRMCATCLPWAQWLVYSLVPRPRPAFRCLQYTLGSLPSSHGFSFSFLQCFISVSDL